MLVNKVTLGVLWRLFYSMESFMPTSPQSAFDSVLKSITSENIVLNPPGNSYEVECVLGSPVQGFQVGDRITGTVHAKALRVHKASGGGAFIEPVVGEPRIVAGRVLANNSDGAVLIRSAIPMLVELSDESDRATCVPGEFVNFHVASGVVFSPSDRS
ncbi:MAG: hypothetical protein MK089_10800 [Phycisphaerales bacterium]|nr:hypothetical protein [Phycisphaerales bacterium]